MSSTAENMEMTLKEDFQELSAVTILPSDRDFNIFNRYGQIKKVR